MDVSLFTGVDRLAMEFDGFNLGILATQGSLGSASANGKAGIFIACLIEGRVDLGDFDHRGLLRCKKEAARCPRRPECVLIIDCAAIDCLQREGPRSRPTQG